MQANGFEENKRKIKSSHAFPPWLHIADKVEQR